MLPLILNLWSEDCEECISAIRRTAGQTRYARLCQIQSCAQAFAREFACACQMGVNVRGPRVKACVQLWVNRAPPSSKITGRRIFYLLAALLLIIYSAGKI